MLDSRIQSRYLHHEELVGRKNNPVKTLDYIQGSNVTGRRLNQKKKEASRDEMCLNGDRLWSQWFALAAEQETLESGLQQLRRISMVQ